MARIAPWLLRPLPFIVGTYSSVVRSRLALRAAFKIDEWLGRDRNAGVEPELHLPRPRLISKAATLRLFPGIRQERLTGAAQWYDYQMVESDRLTFAFAAAADRAGADLANYAEAITPVREGARIAGIQVRDRLNGSTLSIRARMTVNAAGSQAGNMMTAFGVERELPLLEAASLVTSKRASDIALAAPSSSGRMLTLVPWRGVALVGTMQSSGFVAPDASAVSPGELQALIDEANEAFPALKLTPSEVTLVHRGLLPAVAGRDGRAELKPAPDLLDHASQGAEGVFTVIGVKYVAARGVAERAVDAIGRRLGKRLRPSSTATTVLPGAGIADHEALAIETARELRLDVPLTTIRHLMTKYAEVAADIIRLAGERPELLEPLAPDAPTIAAEVVHAIGQEHAMRLSDIVIRRTGLGSARRPGEAALRGAARIAGTELGWDPARIEAEIEQVRSFYPVPLREL